MKCLLMVLLCVPIIAQELPSPDEFKSMLLGSLSGFDDCSQPIDYELEKQNLFDNLKQTLEKYPTAADIPLQTYDIPCSCVEPLLASYLFYHSIPYALPLLDARYVKHALLQGASPFDRFTRTFGKAHIHNVPPIDSLQLINKIKQQFEGTLYKSDQQVVAPHIKQIEQYLNIAHQCWTQLVPTTKRPTVAQRAQIKQLIASAFAALDQQPAAATTSNE